MSKILRTNSSPSVKIDLKWVIILIILKLGEPDLLDAIIKWIEK